MLVTVAMAKALTHLQEPGEAWAAKGGTAKM